MNSITGVGIWSIKKHFNTERLSVKEAGRFHSLDCRGQILPTQYDIHVLSISDSRFINPGNPSSHSISTSYSVENAGLFQSTGGTHQALAHFFHGSNHPFP